MLRILGRLSSINVRKVVWTCEELGLGFEREDWGAGFRPLDGAEFLALNPNGQIPVLIDGNFVLWESNAIIRYLANRYSSGNLLPAEPMARARVDQWIDWEGSELPRAWSYAFRALSRRQEGFDDPAQIAASLRQWHAKMEILEGRLAETAAFVAGPEFSLADIVIGLTAHRWRATPMKDRPPLPAVDAYLHRLDERPAFRNCASSATP